MQPDLLRRTSPGLLVSVRNAAEASAALAGGADIIDVKEPARGSLGAADVATIEGVVAAVNGLRPVTAAAGELLDFQGSIRDKMQRPISNGVTAFKIGLAGCAKSAGWQSVWREAVLHIKGCGGTGPPYPVGVAYADWRGADAPNPRDVLNAARDLNCPAILVDTWDKSSGTLFHHWPADELREFIDLAHRLRMGAVLAGSLQDAEISIAAGLKPDLVAVRTAACDGGRNGTIGVTRVRQLKNAIAATSLQRGPSVQALLPEAAIYRGVKA